MSPVNFPLLVLVRLRLRLPPARGCWRRWQLRGTEGVGHIRQGEAADPIGERGGARTEATTFVRIFDDATVVLLFGYKVALFLDFLFLFRENSIVLCILQLQLLLYLFNLFDGV